MRVAPQRSSFVLKDVVLCHYCAEQRWPCGFIRECHSLFQSPQTKTVWRSCLPCLSFYCSKLMSIVIFFFHSCFHSMSPWLYIAVCWPKAHVGRKPYIVKLNRSLRMWYLSMRRTWPSHPRAFAGLVLDVVLVRISELVTLSFHVMPKILRKHLKWFMRHPDLSPPSGICCPCIAIKEVRVEDTTPVNL